MEETLPESENNDTTKQNAPGNEPEPAVQSPEVKENIESMEIHHHPDLKHKKKHLKEYLIEFLMLFFAVTLGFLAENLREHLSEKDRAGIYAKSLYEDFTTDTSTLHQLIVFTKEKIRGIDSMESNLNHLGDRIRDSILYRSVLSLLSTFQFDNINGAYDQIKSTGSLRFFNQSIVNDLNSYDATSEKLKLMEDWENKLLFETVSAQTIPMFNFKVFEDIGKRGPIVHEMYLKNINKNSIDILVNQGEMIKRLRGRQLGQQTILLQKANEILAGLKKEFSL
jgi:hypothetical protein